MCPNLSAKLAHHRLLSIVAAKDKSADIADRPKSVYPGKLSLLSIANAMNVPVALATYRERDGSQTYATHGLDLTTDLARFVMACSDLCKSGVIVVPDMRAPSTLGAHSSRWPIPDVRFLVAIPLRNSSGEHVGSLAVMNASKAVARKGISFRNLAALGHAFTESGSLQAVIAANTGQ